MMLPVPGTTLNCEPLLYGLLNCKPPLNGVNAWFELKFARHAFYCHKRVGQILIARKYLHHHVIVLSLGHHNNKINSLMEKVN